MLTYYKFYVNDNPDPVAILNMASNSIFLEVTRLFWAKIGEDLAHFPGIYGGLASRKVNLELLLIRQNFCG
jgi:hypothetical protein